MKRYRDEVRAQMAAMGRDPDSCKLLFLLSPLIAETEDQARWFAEQRKVQTAESIPARLARLGWATNIDFSPFDLDAPVGELTTNGTQSTLRAVLVRAGRRTLREAIVAHYGQAIALTW
ncbi:hypothetical protein [Ancylobacter vacuolatus]|uniref:Alkanesulfonate monooxygenase SsuD/methylene tetrahydromethanopterin reductase-like flavin-dependent oxidoreductase (Luciferase family) n=1 Tax=Ancylobacter vacuolatus TaxID=223389 RepID=A0ABU0DKV9_9HYPH|nr:hypothetical protein [Ancylobacter vacuolatus]MDQ0349066.1 alkanesulfonate monooxygenase SsuD/methylene tetrahydromethanopterin reductase-like flavin-dependent oxidoreductase (luciferase family) [Ancylobacter vacuolatus]